MRKRRAARSTVAPLVALALALVLIATATTTPVPAAEAGPATGASPAQQDPAVTETSPGDQPHPVLDEVAVIDTSATRSTKADLDGAIGRQAEASYELIAAETARAEAALLVMEAMERVNEAELHLAEAEEVLAAEKAELTRLTEEEADRLAELEEARGELRSLAAAAYASHALDDVSMVGTFEEMSAGPQRKSLRSKVTEDRMRVVDTRTATWEAAVAAREAQDEVVAEATALRDDRRIDLQTANTARDDAAGVLDDATEVVRDRREAHQARVLATAESRNLHREARLTAPVAGTEFTLVGLHAYWLASAGAPCPTPWWLLAGIGRVESHHGTAQGSRVGADGVTTVPIRGIPLDGRPGVAAIGDTDGGLLDGDTTWDRAVGPMQFIPSTWARWGADGDGDGVADPHNLYDAAASAALYLCVAGRGSLLDEAGQRSGLLAYNRSVPYGNLVLSTGESYRNALNLPALGTPDPEPIDTPEP